MSDIWPPFVGTLPLGLDPLPQASAPTAQEPRRQPSILLIDDDQFMLGMQSRMLRNMGFPMIGTAGSADAALLLLRKDPQAVDVILCDLNMPGTDGIEFLRRLNATEFHGSVILLSGEGARTMHAVQRLLSDSHLVILGALEKPASRVALGALLDTWKPRTNAAPASALPSFTRVDLHTAQQERQWILHYQPKVDLNTGALKGMEALVRWKHPEHGLIYPDRFIGLAEDCGAINALTDWVLRAALGQLARWHGEDIAVQMAVNVSMESLSDPDFARRIGALARECAIAPQDVTLEVTESRLMALTEAPLENLVRLRMQRFGLSIDDFGTGHSSLAQLRDVPFNELKVDRGFVHGARHNQIILPMLEGSVGIAKRLGMQSVAEGVETEEDWHLLREIGCDQAQGYFIGHPMPGERIGEWWEGWQTRRTELVKA